MKPMNAIGLNKKQAALLSSKLNDLLANYSLFYQNVRGYHWNIRGDKFFELHLKFEELYNDLLVKIDEVAERILTLGHSPEHRFSGYSKTSIVRESTRVSNGTKAVQGILDSLKNIIMLQRELLLLSADAGDEGTNSLMSEYIKVQEKLVWMYSSFLDK